MWTDLTHFLYITNREVTVISLCAMFPQDVILFTLMSRYGRLARLAFGTTLVVGFAWACSWFAEPPRPASLEPIVREAFLMALLLVKAYRIVQSLKVVRGKVTGPALRPMTRRERSVSLVAGMGALSLSTAVAIGFWLFNSYRSHEEIETIKVDAVKTQTQMIQEFRGVMAEFIYKQDSTLKLAAQNGQYMRQIKQQGEINENLAHKASRKADQVARRLKAKETEEKRGRSIPVQKIEKRPEDPNYFKRLFKRFSAVPVQPAVYPDNTLTVHNNQLNEDN